MDFLGYCYDAILYALIDTITFVYDFYKKLEWSYNNSVWFQPSKTNQGDLLVEIWELSVTEGVYGAVRGHFTRIQEYHFPELNYSYNIDPTFEKKINHIIDIKENRYKYKKLSFRNDMQPTLVKTKLLTGNNAALIRNIVTEYRHINNINTNDRLKRICKELNE